MDRLWTVETKLWLPYFGFLTCLVFVGVFFYFDSEHFRKNVGECLLPASVGESALETLHQVLTLLSGVASFFCCAAVVINMH